ncbi:MAG: two-component regulator propeller domain-containing protein [Salibacteraceae bacterium]
MKIFSVICFMVITNFSFSQNGSVGEWVDYSPYHSVFSVAEGNGYCYGATNYGLIEFNTSDNSYLRYSKVEGLTSIGISCLGFNEASKTFVVGYTNGKIELLTETEIITINDLFRKTISGNKSLNAMHMYGDYAYIATGFGIVKFDVKRKEFSDTYLVENNGENLKVNDLTISNDTLYAATERGVRKAGIFDPLITYYKTWKQDLNLGSPDAEYNVISSLDSQVYVNLSGSESDTLLAFNDDFKSWDIVNEVTGYRNYSISLYPNFYVLSHGGQVSCYNSNWNEVRRIFNYGEGNWVSSRDAILGNDSVIWVGDDRLGLIKSPKPFSYEIINPPSPYSSGVDGIDIVNNNIWIAAGGRENNWNNNFSNDGVFWRNESLDWGRISKFSDTVLKDVFDFIDIKNNPYNSNLTYGASLGGGLIEFDGYEVSNIFNKSNSELHSAVDNPDWVGVTGLDFDKQGNLWMANSRNANPVAVYTNTKEWYSYNLSQLVSQDITGPMLVADNSYKWIVLPSGGKGILVYDDNGTLDDISDDQSRILNSGSGSGGLPTNSVFSIAEDLDNQIWVGTSEGVAVFYSPSSIFSQGVNFDAQQIIVEVDGYFQYLLGTETVSAIAVDGANRKWLGTTNSGVFLVSADGTEELYHFTKDNSPLISNYIRTIEINNSTGEVLFGTNDGIIAFKGTATGDEVTINDTYAYPNPVPINYYGNIGIKGLPANSEVRITDVAGNLVFSTITEGTQAVWNGNDMNGNRVSTGVYLVMGIDTEGRNSQLAKILFSK